VKVIHLARKPLSESSVAANVLKHGTGALNIGGTRVAHTTVPGGQAKNPHLREPIKTGAESEANMLFPRPGGKALTPTNTGGRWPPNVILEHRAGCRKVGTTKVKAKQLSAGRRTVKWGVGMGGSTYEKGTGAKFATEDGLEDVLVWHCEPGCPVADLDAQSGDRPVSGAARAGRPARKGDTGDATVAFGIEKGNGTLHNDAGGASRFYKQVGGE
jgi:hypothetical protein